MQDKLNPTYPIMFPFFFYHDYPHPLKISSIAFYDYSRNYRWKYLFQVMINSIFRYYSRITNPFLNQRQCSRIVLETMDFRGLSTSVSVYSTVYLPITLKSAGVCHSHRATAVESSICVAWPSVCFSPKEIGPNKWRSNLKTYFSLASTMVI